jgi:MFS family permease
LSARRLRAGAIGDALRAPAYRHLWLAGLFLNTARWIDLLALGWLALELTGSPLMVGVAAFCRSVPLLALGPFGGVLADRLSRWRILIVAQALSLGSAIALAVLFGTGRVGYAGLVAVEVVLGIAWALDFPARRTLLASVVPPGRVMNAVSLETVSMQVGKMIGPAIGGLLLGRVGPAGCYTGLAVLYVGALAATWGLRHLIAAPAPPAPAEPDTAGFVAGLRMAWQRPAIRGVLLITILMNVLVFPYQQMLPVFARDVYGVGPELLGLMVAADGLGALVAAVVVAARHGVVRHTLLFTGGSLVTAVLLLGFAGSPSYGLSVVLLFVMGLAESGFATMQTTLVLITAPAAMRGRAMGILSACIGMGPFGTLWIGFLSSRVGTPLATALTAALALVAMTPMSLRMLARAAPPPGLDAR